MGIRFACPNGHKLNVKEHLAGKRGICPDCGAKFVIPGQSDITSRPANSTVGSQSPALPAETPAPAAESVEARQRPATEIQAPEIVVAPSAPPAPAGDSPPSIVAPSTTAPPAIVTREDDETHAEIPSEALPVLRYAAHRNRSRRHQKSIAIALLALAIVLGIVLVWVLTRNPEADATPTSSGRHAPVSETIRTIAQAPLSSSTRSTVL